MMIKTFKILIFNILTALFSLTANADNSAPWVGESINQIKCYGGGQAYGPFDYTQRANFQPNLNVVENFHFSSQVENLIKGQTGSLEGDLNYVLRAWPNHHRALLSIIHYQLNIDNKMMNAKLATPPECYLQRALNYSKRDYVTFALYGYYLNKKGQKEKAASLYQKALIISPDNPKIGYSYSLLLLELNQKEEALAIAKKIYAKGKAPEGLKNKLIKLGVWK